MNADRGVRPTPEEAALFRAQGFVVLRGLLTPDEVADIEEAFETAVRKATGQGPAAAGVGGGKVDSLVTVVSRKPRRRFCGRRSWSARRAESCPCFSKSRKNGFCAAGAAS